MPRFRLLGALVAVVSVLAGTGSASAVGGPVNALPPSISGSAVVGGILTCNPGTWTPTTTSYTYSWQRDVTTAIGTDSDQYTVTAADVGNAITCMVVASDSAGSSVPAVSVPPVVPVAAPVAGVPIETSLPAISGSAVQGQTVSCSSGAWANGPSGYSYSWQRDGANIAGQTVSQYTLAAADVGQAITCTVVAQNASGDSPPAISLPIVPAAASGNSGGGGSGGGGGGGSGAGSGGGSSGNGGSGPGRKGGTGSKLHAPSVMSFSVAPRKMVISVRGRRQQTGGLTFSYRLSETANIEIAIERRYGGRMVGRRCVAHPPRRAKGKRCTGYTTVATLAAKSARAASDRLKYAGRAGRSLLASGTYRGVVSAKNATGKSNSRSASFAVVRKTVIPRPRR